MSKLSTALLSSLFVAIVAFAPAHAAFAASDCEAKAVSKAGKSLAGAAKASSIKKCEKDAKAAECETKAMSKDGKPLSGAAKASSVKKCMG